MAAQWIWVYGIRPRERAEVWGEPRTESKWLNFERALTPSQRDSAMQARTAPMTDLWGKTEPYYTHAWWTAWNESTRSWAPWVQYVAR